MSSSNTAKDRLRELKEQQGDTNETVENNTEHVEIIIDDKNKQSPELREVFEKVSVVRLWIDSIRENTKAIQELTKNNLVAKNLIHKEIEDRVKNTTSIAFKITNKLKELDVKYDNEEKDKCALTRIQRIQYGTLRQEFQNAIFENNDVLEKYRDRQKLLLQKQATLVNSALTDEELEAIIDNPNGGQFFTDNILLETQHAKDQLAMIEERYTELIKIEKLLEDVRDKFVQMAILVEQQKESINRIEFHAAESINYVDKGLEELEKANRTRKKNKKMMYIIIICVTLLLIVLLLVFIPRL